jgi:NAD(P)-dependent dehydrogenase (short-subunit alcohol dehydrogenase family)
VWQVLALADDPRSLKSRTCLVTGAGRGIGACIAGLLSAAGHRVALTARTTRELKETAAGLPGPSLVVAADLTDPGGVDEVVDRVEAAWGPVEILVANAGVARSAPLTRTDDEFWNLHIDLNLTAAFRCIRRTVPGMVAGGWGRIVATGSTASRSGAKYVSAYAASKHGLLGLVRAVAAEIGDSGVTINAVCPGFVDTRVVEESIANVVALTAAEPAEARERFAKVQGHGRLIDPDEVARAILFLIGEESINGQSLVIDGGALLA